MSQLQETSSKVLLGRVKWFNNKSGFGFITVTDGESQGDDVFVHHSSIKVDSEQYRYLIQGEYVEFVLSDVVEGKHKIQASNVSGIKGGKLMCETRRENRNTRLTHNNNNSVSKVIPRGEGPRGDKEWTDVVRSKKNVDNQVSEAKEAVRRGRKPKQAI